MGLKDWFWPSRDSTNQEETGEEDENIGRIHEEPGSSVDHGTGDAVHDGFDEIGGVMDDAGGSSGDEQKLLGKGSSDTRDGRDDADTDATPGHGGRDESTGTDGSSPSVADLLADDIGENPVQTRDTEEEEPDSDEEPDTEEEHGNPDEEADGHEDLDGDGDDRGSELQFDPDTYHTSTPDNGGRHGEDDDTFMELPQVCVTEQESPDPDASAEEMLPEALPGWELQKTDRYRWQMDNAEGFINATYRDPLDRRYMFHVSKWKPRHVKYALDTLYGFGEPNSFDIWTARGQFVFAVKIAGGTTEDARTLLMAAPALSRSYFQAEDSEVTQ